MAIIRWIRDKDNLGLVIAFSTLVVTALVGWLTWLEVRRVGTSQPAIVSAFSSQYTEPTLLQNGNVSILVICRTELYISNRGGTEALIEILQTRFRPEFFPEVKPVEVNLISTVQHHLDIAAFQSLSVSILTGFHNWGQQPPKLNKLIKFYKTSGRRILKEAGPLSDEPLHLANLGSPVLYGELTRYINAVLVLPNPITSSGKLTSGFPFLDERPNPVLLEGQKLKKLTLDHVVLYLARPEQQQLLSTSQEGTPIYFAAHFMGKGRSFYSSRCSSPGSLPVF